MKNTELKMKNKHLNSEVDEYEDEVFGRLNRLTKILKNYDERGLILSLAAFAEEALGRLIQAFMRPVKASDDLLNGFNAPLGTFSSRIKASYALGLINEEQFKDLELLRKIRNDFAHAWDHVSLEKDNLASCVQNMSFSYLDSNFPETKVEKLKSSMSALLMDVSSMTHQIYKNNAQAKLSGTRLFPLNFHGEFSEQVEQAKELFDSISNQYKEAAGERKRFLIRRLQHIELQVSLISVQVPSDLKPKLLKILSDVKDMLK